LIDIFAYDTLLLSMMPSAERSHAAADAVIFATIFIDA